MLQEQEHKQGEKRKESDGQGGDDGKEEDDGNQEDFRGMGQGSAFNPHHWQSLAWITL